MTPKQTISWKEEINQTGLKYHTIALWIAVVFNLLFFATDYLNLFEYWKEFLSFRIVVSALCLVTVLFHKKLKIPVAIMGVIPVLLISVQNAYMWSVMDAEHLQKHSFAYMALFIGAGMFVFYSWRYSLFIVAVNLIVNVVCFWLNSSLSPDVILLNGAFLVAATAAFSVLLIRMRLRLTKKEIIARLELNQSKQQLEESHKEITDSIAYAKRIQNAILPPDKYFKSYLPESFVFYKPKDIVAGDFYWMEMVNSEETKVMSDENPLLKPHHSKQILFAAADCTGHGVPGAMVSVICNNGLNRSVREHNLTEPADILNKTREIVIKEFEKSEEEVKDGMDIALCSLRYNKETETATLKYAGAHNPLWVIRSIRHSALDAESPEKNELDNQASNDVLAKYLSLTTDNYLLYEIKADKQPIGKFDKLKDYTNHELNLNKGDLIYIFSDGYADQFGGVKGKKLKSSNFKKLLLENCHLSMDEQKEKIADFFESWKNGYEQLDDVCVIGVKI